MCWNMVQAAQVSGPLALSILRTQNEMRTKSHIFLAGAILIVGINSRAQPHIIAQPTNQSVSLGASASFQVSATTAHPPIQYQWRLANTNLPLATSFRLVLTNIQAANA